MREILKNMLTMIVIGFFIFFGFGLDRYLPEDIATKINLIFDSFFELFASIVILFFILVPFGVLDKGYNRFCKWRNSIKNKN